MDKVVVSARQGGMHERVWVAGGKCGGLSVAEPLPLGMCQAWNFVGEMVCSRVEGAKPLPFGVDRCFEGV